MSRAEPTQKFFFTFAVTFIFMLLLLTACGDSSNTTSKASTSSSPPPTNNATPVATITSISKLAALIGQPKVKMLSGTSFEADGQIKNNDTYQHDFTLKVALLDSTGKIIATATQLVDNVKGGNTENYAIQGTTTQPSWSSVEVSVIKVSENIDGSGSD